MESCIEGSRALAGTFDAAVLNATDAKGVTLIGALRAFGLDPARINEAAKQPNDVLAYVELHIEQGPVLEAEELPVGVVTAINGATRYTVERIFCAATLPSRWCTSHTVYTYIQLAHER